MYGIISLSLSNPPPAYASGLRLMKSLLQVVVMGYPGVVVNQQCVVSL
jgi:hypothetical protein